MTKSANSIGTAADGVAGLNLEGPMAKVASALPGSLAVGAANGLKGEWKSDKDTWVKDAREHKRVTTADADAIVETDTLTGQAGKNRREMMERY
ncbi:hypothetical protein FB381_1552 [Nocardioides albertanoniae]|uniref:Uncharacterized protein n=1 Tax=Nocardioides albertanoniae TaxID=1175486 RepID=A0A543A4Z7_9ACTN|nr:hypothetical protein [Nocardioides albertanoniae]TQL67670.1 hypothetical protein FB381_1552 [Nocardioides albertanoniae]